MKSFFDKDKYETTKKYSCVSCGLYKHCQSPKMEPTGGFAKKILIIGDQPTEIEDVHGQQFLSRKGKFLKKTLQKNGISLEEDCLSVNAIRCYTKKPIQKLNIEACRNKVFEVINKYKPKIIITLGDLALQSVLAHRWKKDFDNVHKWRGYTIPDQDLGAWLCPVYDPAFVQISEEQVHTIWHKDFNAIKQLLHKKVPKTKEPEIEYVTDLSFLDNLKSGDYAFDYETTGLKPHAKGHKIICASVADSKDHVWVFPMPDNAKDRKPFIDFLQRQACYKIAHNMKFEDNWTNVILGTEIQGWKFDGQIAAHLIDNRTGVTGLKFLVYVYLGIVDYDSDISGHMKSVDGTANGFNKLDEFYHKNNENARKLLRYCALDSAYEFAIAQIQKKKMDYDFFPF